MATQKRINDLQRFCKQWRQLLDQSTKRRDELLSLQSRGVSIFENHGKNLLPKIISEADSAARQYQRILTKMESVRDRAIAGDD